MTYRAEDWKPGDVAMVTGEWARGVRQSEAAVKIAGGWQSLLTSAAIYNGDAADARRLVVIDPEDCEQARRLVKSLTDAWPKVVRFGLDPDDRDALDAIYITATQAALREFANPTPPEVYEHLPVSGGGEGHLRAWCGKVWKPDPNVRVMGRCPECVEFTEKGWTA